MFPKNLEAKLRTTIQFYTNLKMKRAKKSIDNGQIPLFEMSEKEKIKCLKELVRIAFEINKEAIKSMEEVLNVKEVKERINKKWVTSLFGIIDNDTSFEKLQKIRLDRVEEMARKWKLNVFDNGKLNNTKLKTLKDNIYLYRNNKEVREIISDFESGKFSREDIKKLDDYLKRRNENIARNETGNLYSQEVKDLMIENDLEYYIWRTVGDDRVREEHAEREGLKFSIYDSPLPGEDFNCRCWAEPIKNK